VALKFYDFLVPTQRRDFGAALIEIVSYSLTNWVLFSNILAVRNAATPTTLQFGSGIALMMYLFGAPVLLALVIYYMKASRKLRSLLTRLNIRITDPSPTAFDHFFQEGLSCYIVFHLKSKETLGGTTTGNGERGG